MSIIVFVISENILVVIDTDVNYCLCDIKEYTSCIDNHVDYCLCDIREHTG